jgi:hypothetical protein
MLLNMMLVSDLFFLYNKNTVSAPIIKLWTWTPFIDSIEVNSLRAADVAFGIQINIIYLHMHEMNIIFELCGVYFC